MSDEKDDLNNMDDADGGGKKKKKKGLNPFIINPPHLCGLIISLVIRSLFPLNTNTAELAYSENISNQAIQNLVMLLKVMYPRMNDGLMPNLEDLLKCFNNSSVTTYSSNSCPI